MRLLRKLLILLLGLSLIFLSFCFSVVQTLSSAAKINSMIREADYYTQAKQIFINQLDKSVALPKSVDKAKLKSVVEQSISADDIEKSVEPVLVDVVTWLNTSSSAPAPKLVINLGLLRQKLEHGIESNFDQSTASELIFGLTSQFSDQIIIPLGESGQNNGVLSAQTVEHIKYSYIFLKNVMWLPSTVAVICSILLFVMHIKQGRRKLQKPAWGFFIAGTSILILTYLLPYFLITNTSTVTAENAAPKLAKVVLVDVRFWGYVWLVICLMLLIFSLVLKKPDQRKH